MASSAHDAATHGWSAIQGWLDPAEPFLADHRPGGEPLLGTVGGLEILAGLVVAAGGPAIGWLADVEAIKPIVVAGGRPQPVTARWKPVGGDAAGPGIAAELLTTGAAGETRHVSCVFGLSAPGQAEAGPTGHAIARLGGTTVGPDMIYGAFFHGPAFRVVAQAGLYDRTMVAQLASPLPRWSTAPGASRIGPRLIEFGLQTAGLLQLARDGAMMIPRRIGRIDRFRPTDVDFNSPLYAIATRSDPDPRAPIDVQIVDADGTVHLTISGYCCVPLPFAADDAPLTILTDLLRAGMDD